MSGTEGNTQIAALMRAGIAAARSGDRALARRCFRQIVGLDPRNETAWLWLAGLSDDPRASLAYLSRALEINPENARAKAGLRVPRVNLQRTAQVGQAGPRIVRQTGQPHPGRLVARVQSHNPTKATPGQGTITAPSGGHARPHQGSYLGTTLSPTHLQPLWWRGTRYSALITCHILPQSAQSGNCACPADENGVQFDSVR